DGAAEALPADGEKETEAVLVGNAVHLVLERFAYGEKKTDRMLRTAAEYLSAQGLAENEIEADYLPAVKPMLENFLSSPLAGRRALGVEVPFSLILEDVEIKGTIDRIETDHTLVDYKTGSFSMKESHELALNVYALGAEKILKLSPEKLVLFFLSSNEMRSVKKWPSGETEEKVRGAVRKIKSGEFESAGEKECSRCFYREACRIAASKREEPR
ncbi:MAG TPA: PD-(D/E)XK nuclease family protein, partial [bacterium]|nr:PD-(D/E)XK nuclease family protein [bacterium]